MSKGNKYLFFIEREFHLVLLLPLMQYIYEKALGEMAIYNFSPEQSQQSISNYGLRKNILDRYLDFEVKQIENPYLFSPDITFMADFSYQYVEGLGKIVNIGHGTIAKGWYYSQNKISVRENCADLLCVPGNIHKHQLEKNVKIPIEVTGMPKLDKAFTGKLKRDEILKKMGLNLDNKTVLLAPTFNDEFSLIPYLTEPIRNYIPDYLNLIVKLHGVTPDNIRDAFKKIASTTKNVFLNEDYDITECFVASDVMISDVSSVVYEFLSLGKPVLLFDSPKQQDYQNYSPEDIEYKYRNVGHRFSSPTSIPELLFRSLTEKRDEKIDSIADGFVSVRDGSSARRVVEAANALLEKPTMKKAHIIVVGDNKENIARIKYRFQDRFNMSFVPANDEKSLMSLIKSMANSIQEDYILVHDIAYEMSPQMPHFLHSQLILNDHAGLAVPLMYNDEINYQQAKLRVRLNDEYSLGSMALQLTYAFSGQSIEIPFAEPVSYIFSKQSLLDTTFESENNDQNWLLFLSYLKEKSLSIELCFDSMIYPAQVTNNTKEQIVNHKKEENDLQYFVSLNSEEGLKQRIIDNPKDDSVKLDLIDFYYKNEMWDSIEIYADMMPNNYKAVWYATRSLEEQSFVEEALNRIKSLAIDKTPDTHWKARLYALQGKLLLKLNHTAEARVFIDLAIKADNDLNEALVARAAYYLMNGDFEHSEADYKKILDREPQNRIALLGLGMIKQFGNDYQASEEFFITVLNDNEEDLEAINGLVKSVWHTKNFELAVNALKTYLELHPAQLDILFTLAGIYFELGFYNDALEQLEIIMLFDNDYLGANELYNKIKQINK
ncbi:MAG TPA: CDP-glycerol glycerophosphotransferase family protein [Candidatus Cloacimonadota bacterium]|nr:CDP-glycerol glycerophosphotransferase family protein [Candidatus Cloacimonadota bacterium]